MSRPLPSLEPQYPPDLKPGSSYRWLETNVDADEREEEEEDRWVWAAQSLPRLGVLCSHGGQHHGASGPKADARWQQDGLLLSPRIQKALEGVRYIADHLRSEDADSSVSWGRERGSSSGWLSLVPRCLDHPVSSMGARFPLLWPSGIWTKL